MAQDLTRGNGISIRKAIISDLPSIMSIVAEVVPILNSENNYQWSEAYPLVTHFEKDIQDDALYVATLASGDHAETVVGVIAIVVGPGPEYNGVAWNGVQREDHQVIVPHRLAVSPKIHKKGIAQQLMQYCEVVAREKNIDCIRADTNVLNARMQHIFKKLGYEHTGDYLSDEPPYGVLEFPCYQKILNLDNRAHAHTEIVMRKAVKTDLPQIMQIIKQVVPLLNANGNFQWNDTYPSASDYEKDIDADDLYVATLSSLPADENVVGVVGITLGQPKEYDYLPRTGEIRTNNQVIVLHRLAVSPKIHKKGVAQRLMLFSEEVAKGKGIDCVRADTNVLNTQMQYIFKKLGYEYIANTHFDKGKYGILEFPVFQKFLKLDSSN